MTETIQILYRGDDITSRVEFASASFTSMANGQPGPATLRIKDDARIYERGYFHAGGTLELFINDSREWDGWVIDVAEEYYFPVEDTRKPNPPHTWSLTGSDRNLLFTRRFLYLISDPTTNNQGFPAFPPGTLDSVIIAEYLAKYVDLTGDDLDVVTGIETVGTPGFWEQFVVGGLGDPWATMFDDIVKETGAVYYIDPDRVIRYTDDFTPNAPFALSDVPDDPAGCVNYREMLFRSSGDALGNDAFVWGAGKGSSDPVFARSTDADSIAAYGVWQWSSTVLWSWKQETVQHRADTYVSGSPTHHRGHKTPLDFDQLAIFEPGIRLGMVVDLYNHVFDYHDTIPVRSLAITFPTPHDVRWDLLFSHTIDEPFDAFDVPGSTQHLTTETFTQTFPGWGPPIPTAPDTSTTDNAGGPYGTGENIVIGFESNYYPAGYIGTQADPPAQSVWGSSNVAWPLTPCGVGLGGWYGEEYSEVWYQIPLTRGELGENNMFVELPAMAWHGVAGETGVTIGVATWEGPLTVAAMKQWWTAGRAAVNEPSIVEIHNYLLPTADLTEAGVYIVLAPSWAAAASGDIICDCAYISGACDTPWGENCYGKGPRCTGQADSGFIECPIDLSFTCQFPVPEDLSTSIVTWDNQNTPMNWQGGSGLYQTEYPYVPGTLQIWFQGQLLRPLLDFAEVDPATGLFRIVDQRDLQSYLVVRYVRAGNIPATPKSGATGSTHHGGRNPADPYGGDSTAKFPGGRTGGHVYRPNGIEQLGWGSMYDSTNCTMASGCMALERHSLGALTPWQGSPSNRPPEMRILSGRTDAYSFVHGTNVPDVAVAWRAGWGAELLIPGYVSWDYFVKCINEGRGAILQGIYGSLPNNLRFQQGFTSGHAIYINEQWDDGAFWGYDPLYRYPVRYPYAAMQAYALSYGGQVFCGFTRKTGLQ